MIFNMALEPSQMQWVYENSPEDIAIPTGLEQNTGIPRNITLKQNYPNPFNPATTIEYQLPETGKVSLSVFDITGRKIAALVNENAQSAGRYRVRFDADKFVSGVYVYRLRVGSQTFDKKMVLIK